MIALSRRVAALVGAAILVVACGSSGGSTAPTPGATAGATGSTQTSAATTAPVAGGLLDKVLKAGKLQVSTDPNYKPQSFTEPDPSDPSKVIFKGFDIDVANEIGKRLGVTVEFQTPSWDAITAGSWAGRWDVSVGSMTITVPRQAVLDFTSPYYYTPAQMTATTKSGITTIDGLAGKTVCVASATTYLDWLEGKLQSVSLGPVATAPAGITPKILDTDQLCAQAIAAGQNVGEGFLSASTVIDSAISDGTPIVKVGNPVFVEQLAASVDKGGPDPSDFVTTVSKIIDDMHADGTLTGFSMKWFNADLTKPPA
jgi:polar amino acid transport system substrate-binding protein